MFLNYRRNRLLVKLAGAEAALVSFLESQALSSSIFPSYASQLSREIGELKERLRQLNGCNRES